MRFLTALLFALLAAGSASAADPCVYLGGYPWQQGGCLTSADLNAAFATALAPPTTLAPGVAATNLGNAAGDVSGPWSNLQIAKPLSHDSLPTPTVLGLGGVTRVAPVNGFFLSGIDTSGHPQTDQALIPTNNLSEITNAYTAGSNVGLGTRYWAKSFVGVVSNNLCTWDSTHDGGDCINKAIAAAAAAGGGTVIIPQGVTGLSVMPLINTSGISLACDTPSVTTGTNPTTINSNGCELKWIGSTAGRMVSVSVSTGQLLACAVRGIRFNGNNGLAADGLYVGSTFGCHLDDLTFVGGFNNGTVVNLDVNAVTAGGAQNNTVDNLYIDNGTGGPYTSDCLRFGAFIDGTGVHGNASQNNGRNVFIGCGKTIALTNATWAATSGGQVTFTTTVAHGLAVGAPFTVIGTTPAGYNGRYVSIAGTTGSTVVAVLTSNPGAQSVLGTFTQGTGILCQGCDNQNLTNVRVFDAGVSLDLSIAKSGANLYPANGNIINHFSGTGTAIARGTDSFTTCTQYSTCSYNNYISIDQTNGTPSPLTETAADLHWGSNSGYEVNRSFTGFGNSHPAIVVAEDLSIWGTCVNNSRSFGPLVAAYICSSSGGALVFLDDVQGDRMGIRTIGSAGAANWLFEITAGTGKFQIANPILMGTLTPGASATPMNLNLGASYSNAAGTNAKIKVYDDGSLFYGLGVSAAAGSYFDYMAPSSAGHNFYINGVSQVRIDGSGITPVKGVSSAGGFSTSCRTRHSGGVGGTPATSEFSVQTPVITEVYTAEVFVPGNCTITGVAIYNSATISGNVKVGLADSAGNVLATSASTAVAGVSAYQRVPFTGTYAAVGPATYYILVFFDNTTIRPWAHTVGSFGAGKLTAQTYATGFVANAALAPTTFTTALGPVASLY